MGRRGEAAAKNELPESGNNIDFLRQEEWGGREMREQEGAVAGGK